MPTRQDIVSDLCRQVSRLIGTANALMERYARAMEFLDSLPSWFERLESTEREQTEEIARARDSDNFWRKRLEKLAIANLTGDTKTVNSITQDITGEHLQDWLQEQIIDKQNEIRIHTRNINVVQLEVAKQGRPTVEQVNQLDDWQRKIDRLNEAIQRMRQELDAKKID